MDSLANRSIRTQDVYVGTFPLFIRNIWLTQGGLQGAARRQCSLRGIPEYKLVQTWAEGWAGGV